MRQIAYNNCCVNVKERKTTKCTLILITYSLTGTHLSHEMYKTGNSKTVEHVHVKNNHLLTYWHTYTTENVLVTVIASLRNSHLLTYLPHQLSDVWIIPAVFSEGKWHLIYIIYIVIYTILFNFCMYGPLKSVVAPLWSVVVISHTGLTQWSYTCQQSIFIFKLLIEEGFKNFIVSTNIAHNGYKNA